MHVASVNSYTAPLSEVQAEQLRSLLAEQGFEFQTRPYTTFFAQKKNLSVAVYEKGPKAVIQGRETENFVRYELEPKILGEARLGYEEVLHPEMFEPHFGIDESGKGDLFGPLVIAGVYVDRSIAQRLLALGAVDSKRIGSDRRIQVLAQAIREIPGIAVNVVLIGPEKYNELYDRFGNLNDLLAWGHARVIENLAAQRPECPRALSDKFAHERVILNALMAAGRKIELDQRTKAEADLAVAAASILARDRFVHWLERKGKELGVSLPKGVSESVKAAARTLVERLGPEILPSVAKMHFKTVYEVLGEQGG
ncbi:MAG: ribonuclease HIII [Verrucomicrobia bacterium]|nr:ribonuclease HIII [Verrucomicrobiota bacterium]